MHIYTKNNNFYEQTTCVELWNITTSIKYVHSPQSKIQNFKTRRKCKQHFCIVNTKSSQRPADRKYYYLPVSTKALYIRSHAFPPLPNIRDMVFVWPAAILQSYAAEPRLLVGSRACLQRQCSVWIFKKGVVEYCLCCWQRWQQIQNSLRKRTLSYTLGILI